MKLGELTVYNTLRLLEEWAVEFDATSCAAARAAIPWHSSPDDGSLIADLLAINIDEATDEEGKHLLSRDRVDEELELQQSIFPKNNMFRQLIDMFKGKLDSNLKAELADSKAPPLVSRTKCDINALSMVICFSFSLGL